MAGLRDIKSIDEIVRFLLRQADLRAPENDEAGVLEDLAKKLRQRVARLEKQNKEEHY